MSVSIDQNPLTSLMVIFMATCLLMSQTSTSTRPWKNLHPPLPKIFLDVNITAKLRTDPDAIESASHDWGNITRKTPAAVFYPSSVEDIASLIKLAYSNNNSVNTFRIAARGCAHSVRGQAMANSGVIVNMTSLNSYRNWSGVVVFGDKSSGLYADVGGEQLWIDVLNATLGRGVAPISWTDYLYITVGGTLSNAGISGQTFRYGPQITNVHEMDVITGKGELVTCSTNRNSDLFYAVLGGLGQFGIITRARIVLDQAPKRVKWVRMLYNDFFAFTIDQERLISISGREHNINALDYLEGQLLLDNGSPDTSFFSPSDRLRIISLVKEHSIIYCLEVAKYYDDSTQNSVDKELQLLFKGLSFIAGFIFEKDVLYIDFLNRVRSEELVLRSQGLWDVPHPWLNLFIPKSRILDFNKGVFTDIVLKQNITKGVILVYPMNRNKWDDRMSAIIPDEEIFYKVGFLNSGGLDNWQEFDDQNKEIMQFCDKAGIMFKQYLPHYITQNDWIKQFGSKWNTFRQRKALFDPKMILSPGQGIFNQP